ncbi:MAG: ACP S-malonyltransferase [Actinomycetia bacterium]|nr:ACP S-malonyltransferase [Actinomycetes bacterium]
MLAIVAPGQGAQHPGFLAPWLELPACSALVDALSAIVRLDLAALGSTADAGTLQDTAVAQPLLVVAAIGAARALDDGDALADPRVPTALHRGDVVAGHSVGEIGAAVLAGILSDCEAAHLVRERSAAMAALTRTEATGMAALLGGEPDAVLAAIAAAGASPANFNGPGQIVAGGTLRALAALRQAAPARCRVRPLAVAGAFHTDHMTPAVAGLAEVAAGLHPHDPAVPFVSNLDGTVVTDGAEALDRLTHQIALPVRWDLCLTRFATLGVTGLLELPPAGTLVALARRALPGVATFTLDRPDQLDDARAFVASHTGALT